jgi:tRNA(fMet)-specific endonuclease VapC
MYVLDTDILTLRFMGHLHVTARQQSVPSGEIAIFVISWIQAMSGRFDFLLKAANGDELLRAQRLLDVTRASLASVAAVLPIDERAAVEFDRLRENRKLRKIGRADLLIATIALANGATLVTRNPRDFRQVPGLRIENWAD